MVKRCQNLMEITKLYSLFATPAEVEIMKEKFLAGNYGYGHAKKELFERILDYFSKQRELRMKLENNMDYVYDILKDGAKIAREITSEKMKVVRDTVGLIGGEL